MGQLTSSLEYTSVVLINPDIYLREIQENLYETTGIESSSSAICHFLQRVNFSRQKLKIVAKQSRCDTIYDPEMLVFLIWTDRTAQESMVIVYEVSQQYLKNFLCEENM